MAGADVFGLAEDSLSEHALARMGGKNFDLGKYLFPLSRGAVRVFDDFLGDTIDLDKYLLTKDVTTAADFAIALAAGGTIAGTTGATDDEAHSLIGPAIWLGDNNCGMEVRLKLNSITSINLEVGFIDAATDKTLPVITDVDTPASGNGASDIAVFHIDTDQTLTTAAWVTDGVTASMNCTKSNIGTFTPTADTYFRIRIQRLGDLTAFMLADTANGPFNPAYTYVAGETVASRVEGGTLVAPWIFIRTRTAGARVCTVDYIDVWADR